MLNLYVKNNNVSDLIDSVFDDFFTTNPKPLMRTDIKEEEDKYLFDIEIPGYTKEDIKISLEEGYLNVEAVKEVKKEEKEDDKIIRKERYYGNQSRSFYVGYEIDDEKIQASYNNGILSITVFKAKKEETRKYISIE